MTERSDCRHSNLWSHFSSVFIKTKKTSIIHNKSLENNPQREKLDFLKFTLSSLQLFQSIFEATFLCRVRKAVQSAYKCK